jgi:hypothetical protein
MTNPTTLQALARLNRDARAGVLVNRATIYALKYRAIAAAIADGSARVERVVVQGRCRSPWHGHYEADECDVCGGTDRVSLGFALIHIGGIRWHIPDHTEPGRGWAAGVPVVDAGQWQPGEREGRREPLDVLSDLVAVEQALGSAGEYDLELGAMGDTGHTHEAGLGPAFSYRHRRGRLRWEVTTCWGCVATPVATPLVNPLVAEWVALHPGCLDYTPPPAVPRRRGWR